MNIHLKKILIHCYFVSLLLLVLGEGDLLLLRLDDEGDVLLLLVGLGEGDFFFGGEGFLFLTSRLSSCIVFCLPRPLGSLVLEG